jgi:hypothetical protein
MEPLPGNGYSAFIRSAIMDVIEVLASKGGLLCFRCSRICHRTVAWQWLFRVYSFPQLWVLSKHWLAMEVCSASDVPAFRQYATILSVKWCYIFKQFILLFWIGNYSLNADWAN